MDDRPLPMPQMMDRLPPHSIECEQIVLGCIFLSPNDCMGICVEKLQSEDFFYDMRHQALYAHFVEMFTNLEVIEPMLVMERLRSKNQLEALGGMPYIASLLNCAISAAGIEHYIGILREKFVLRSLIRVGTVIARNGYEAESAAVALEESEREMVAIGQALQVGSEDRDIGTIVTSVLDEMDEAEKNQGKPRGLTVGFPDLDSLTSGFRGGQVIVIAARPSVGKTSFAMNMAEDVAVNQKIPVGVFSMEMTAEELVFRLTCSRSRVNSKTARDGRLSERETVKVIGVGAAISKSPLHICGQGGMTIGQLAGRARRMYQRFKVKMLIVDYIQLMQSHHKASRNEQLTIISNGIKALAKELNIPIIVISQLNRESTKENRSPRMSDLRECGAIEQDADIIILLDPTVPDDKKDKKKKSGDDEDRDPFRSIPDAQEVTALIPKNRNGPVNAVELTFMRSWTRFESRSKVADVQI